MSAFSDLESTAARKPLRVVNLEPTHFADDWGRRPKAAICIGLRLLSDAEIQTARATADAFAVEMHQTVGPRLEAYNDALMRHAVARAMCDPNNVEACAPLFEMAEDQVRTALRSETIRWLFEEIESLAVETGPLHLEADDDDLEDLRAYLEPAIVDALDPAARRRARRFARFLLAELIEAPIDDPAPELPDE